MVNPADKIVRSVDVSTQYIPSKTDLVGRVVKLEIQGGSSPWLRYIGSALKNLGLCLIGMWNRAFKSIGLDKCTRALSEDTQAKISRHVMTLADPERNAPVDATCVKKFFSQDECSPLDSRIKAMKTEIDKDQSDPTKKQLFFLPISTLVGSESHVVGLVVDTKSKQLLFLDTKGSKPEKLCLADDARGKTVSQTSCLDIITHVVKQGNLEGYTLSLTPDIQKVRDCSICVMAMVGGIAEKADHGEAIDLPAIVANIHQNYDQIDAIRAKCLK